MKTEDTMDRSTARAPTLLTTHFFQPGGVFALKPLLLRDWGGSLVNLRRILPAWEPTVVWLFLLQSLRVLFPSLSGVIYNAVFEQSVSFSVVGLDPLPLTIVWSWSKSN